MDGIESKLELLQKQIESTIEPMMKSSLFLKKIDLLKQQKANKLANKLDYRKIDKTDYKRIIDELEKDIKERLV